MKLNIISLSHNDLDGIFCSVLLNQVFNLVELPVFSSYRKLPESLDYVKYLCTKQKIDYIFITDLHLSTKEFQNKVNEIANTTKVIIIDHHFCIKKELDTYNNPNIIYHFDQTICATKITHNLLMKKTDLSKWSELINRINAFDVWDNNSEYFNFGLALSDLVWTYSSPIKVFNKFKNGIKHEMKKPLLNELSDIIEKRNLHIQKLENKNLILKVNDFCISFTDDFIHHIQLRNPNFKYYINITSYNNITFKTQDEFNSIINGKENSFQEFINSHVEINNMGGHENILSVSLNNINMDKIINLIKKFINLYYQNKGEIK